MHSQETARAYMEWLAKEPERYAAAVVYIKEHGVKRPSQPKALRELAKSPDSLTKATNKRIDNCIIAKDLSDYRFIHR